MAERGQLDNQSVDVTAQAAVLDAGLCNMGEHTVLYSVAITWSPA